jgi:hypothetical protein
LVSRLVSISEFTFLGSSICVVICWSGVITGVGDIKIIVHISPMKKVKNQLLKEELA